MEHKVVRKIPRPNTDVIKTLGEQGVATVHGFRSSFRTWASKQGFNEKAAEHCLAHAFGGRVQQSYDHDDTIEVRTTIMQAWADFLEGRSNVIQLARAA